MFLLLGYGEKAGSGSTRILNAWEGAHWRKPLIWVESHPERVELCLNMEQLLPQKSIDRLISIFGKEISEMYGDGLIALTTAEMEGCVSNVRLQQLLNKHSSEISLLLKDLCNEKYLELRNKGRWTIYRLNNRKEKKCFQKKLFEEKVDTSKGKVDTSDCLYGKRLSFSDLKMIILSYCEGEYRSADEIATFVNRDLKYLKNKILPTLLKEEVLERLYPTIPNHPNQAYRTKCII